MNTYDRVKILLQECVNCRNSDKELLWEYWTREINMEFDSPIVYDQFINCTPAESITRARRSVQQRHPELQANETVQKFRMEKSGQIVFLLDN